MRKLFIAAVGGLFVLVRRQERVSNRVSAPRSLGNKHLDNRLDSDPSLHGRPLTSTIFPRRPGTHHRLSDSIFMPG